MAKPDESVIWGDVKTGHPDLKIDYSGKQINGRPDFEVCAAVTPTTSATTNPSVTPSVTPYSSSEERTTPTSEAMMTTTSIDDDSSPTPGEQDMSSESSGKTTVETTDKPKLDESQKNTDVGSGDETGEGIRYSGCCCILYTTT
jgi:hypothetical protein